MPRRKLIVGDKVMYKHRYRPEDTENGLTGVVVQRDEAGGGFCFGELRVKLDNGKYTRDAIQHWVLDRGQDA